jgi:hypothetical protein
MILLAALAIGLILVRKNLLAEFEPFPRSPELIPNVVSAWAALLLTSLEVGTLAIVLLTLRHPRPALKRLTLRPGFVACGAAAVILSIGAAANVLYLGVGAVLRHWPGGWVPYQDSYPVYFSSHVGQISYAVAVCWAFMAAGGRWRPEPEWVDRLGRGFGFCVGMIPYISLHLGLSPTTATRRRSRGQEVIHELPGEGSRSRTDQSEPSPAREVSSQGKRPPMT